MMRRHLDRFAGHAWTILPTLRHRVSPIPIPRAVPWAVDVDDPDVGGVTIRGQYAQTAGADTLVVLIHGLGGSPDSGYLAPLAQAAGTRGWSSLRLALRGTDGIGNDFYHAGLTDDVEIALADEAFADYSRIFVVGFSLGGHIAMCVSTLPNLDERVRAVAAVCPPVDLGEGARLLDAPSQTVYRNYILSELRALYRGVAATTDVPTPWSRIKLVRHIREWDALTIVPRFGFENVDHYYSSQSVANRIDTLRLPTLMVHSHDDPVVIPETVYPMTKGPTPQLDVHWFDGAGHVYFPPSLDLGVSGPRGLGPQVLSWLERAETK